MGDGGYLLAASFRHGHSKESMMAGEQEELISECRRQEESCLYTGASLMEWQKHATWMRAVFLVLPVILGGFGGAQILTEVWGKVGNAFAALSALCAGFFPAIYTALDMDMRVQEIARSANEFTNLRDRFRQAANIRSQAPIDEFKAHFETLMDRMDAARLSAPPAPEWCFKRSQKKIGKGDYNWDSASIKPKARANA